MENKMILASPRASGKFTLNVDALGRPELDPHSVGGLESSTDPDCVLAVMPEDEPLSPSQHGISFDDALTKYVGEFGKGQVRRGCRVTVAEPSLAAAKSRWC
eukprot:GHUV01040811.1.p2 GENE.GHUV01040811.1~~GHUV01040811.1.p2  ORF type:complete len:102 (+),score=4.34 GHUV01040811.1:775-1080(+)